MGSKFGTAINCIDGRVQEPVSEFIRKNYGLDYVDMITTPGPDKILCESEDSQEIESVRKKVSLSCRRRSSKLIFIAGHHDCLANPCSEEEHLRQIKKAVANIREWKLAPDVCGIWVGKDWKARLI